ncbi:flippase-like domain-containing protein [Candidatus Woesearchaeota archaeon]|nr:flippase-like domain-containing protein [Candidatus Woesearchaeota archaeon]
MKHSWYQLYFDRSLVLRFLFYFLMLTGIVVIIKFISTSRDDFALFFAISPIYLALIIALLIVTAMLVGIKTKYLIDLFGIKIPFSDAFGLTIIADLSNYILPFKAGSTVRAIYFKQKYDLKYHHYINALAAGVMVSLLVYGLAGLAGVLFMAVRGAWLGNSLPIFFACILAGAIAIIFAPLTHLTRRLPAWRIFKPLHTLAASWSTIKHKPAQLAFLCCIELLFIAGTVLMTSLAFFALKHPLPLSTSLFITLFTNLSSFIAITPAGIGIREAATIWSATFLGEEFSVSFQASLLIRILLFIVSTLFGFAYLWHFLRKEKSAHLRFISAKKPNKRI